MGPLLSYTHLDQLLSKTAAQLSSGILFHYAPGFVPLFLRFPFFSWRLFCLSLVLLCLSHTSILSDCRKYQKGSYFTVSALALALCLMLPPLPQILTKLGPLSDLSQLQMLPSSPSIPLLPYRQKNKQTKTTSQSLASETTSFTFSIALSFPDIF